MSACQSQSPNCSIANFRNVYWLCIWIFYCICSLTHSHTHSHSDGNCQTFVDPSRPFCPFLMYTVSFFSASSSSCWTPGNLEAIICRTVHSLIKIPIQRPNEWAAMRKSCDRNEHTLEKCFTFNFSSVSTCYRGTHCVCVIKLHVCSIWKCGLIVATLCGQCSPRILRIRT